MINFHDLQIFIAVVSSGSMSDAGRAHGLSPAVVSKRIKRLEDQLGTRLLQRTTRQLSLTEIGQGFYDRGLAILAGLEDAESYIAGRSAETQGILKISAPTSFGRMHVAPNLKVFMARHPNLAINLVLTDEMTDIVGGGFDVAIRIAELIDSSLVARRLAPVRRVLCASPAYIAEHGAPSNIDDLDRHTCIPAHNNDAWRLEGPSGHVTLRPEGMLNTNSSEVIREAVIAGLGIALRSTWDVGPELKQGRLVQVLQQFEGSQNVALSAVYPSRQHLPSKVRLFIDFLADLYGPVPYWEL
ncbi:LysR family transcriptional regulator [Rhizobium sp. VS19-DR104.2]|uniref:LysR family transcriptional regulator n=1 Tax=unclassified Rhizobium TaxID=2613769 RepID=UPI001ADCF4BF|nr:MULTISPECIES: LysR family transcriptional regulator [unclassified Rhizobium]MBO9101487.1 LysR family transcriptional regulator [Rhizobium sp. L58/93]MBO9134854.1 LysR family transcriptional regulator [Rhizobium sp. B209b/85]MBO9171727.1 LysR family transcriptional regulator [Rhizobium sp. L245/93]MBO9187478.1 LysR family transcriptional regulator [Rhizobium sp. E27B/91]MBZ5762771.1 LysR family transcriptional regulator [Rhizobium sp. VS19-DR96]